MENTIQENKKSEEIKIPQNKKKNGQQATIISSDKTTKKEEITSSEKSNQSEKQKLVSKDVLDSKPKKEKIGAKESKEGSVLVKNISGEKEKKQATKNAKNKVREGQKETGELVQKAMDTLGLTAKQRVREQVKRDLMGQERKTSKTKQSNGKNKSQQVNGDQNKSNQKTKKVENEKNTIQVPPLSSEKIENKKKENSFRETKQEKQKGSQTLNLFADLFKKMAQAIRDKFKKTTVVTAKKQDKVTDTPDRKVVTLSEANPGLTKKIEVETAQTSVNKARQETSQEKASNQKNSQQKNPSVVKTITTGVKNAGKNIQSGIEKVKEFAAKLKDAVKSDFNSVKESAKKIFTSKTDQIKVVSSQTDLPTKQTKQEAAAKINSIADDFKNPQNQNVKQAIKSKDAPEIKNEKQINNTDDKGQKAAGQDKVGNTAKENQATQQSGKKAKGEETYLEVQNTDMMENSVRHFMKNFKVPQKQEVKQITKGEIVSIEKVQKNDLQNNKANLNNSQIKTVGNKIDYKSEFIKMQSESAKVHRDTPMTQKQKDPQLENKNKENITIKVKVEVNIGKNGKPDYRAAVLEDAKRQARTVSKEINSQKRTITKAPQIKIG